MDDLGLENTVTLKDVVYRDRDLYLEVCEGYSNLFGIAIQLLDDRGNRLVGITGPNSLCKKAYTVPSCRAACQETITAIRKETPAFRTLGRKVCFCGTQYRVVPIHHETEVIGKVVFGPFLPNTVDDVPDSLFELVGETTHRKEWWWRIREFSRLDTKLAGRLSKNLAVVIEVMAFIGFKGQMTTDMHVLSTSEAYAELADKNEELERQARMLRHRADLRSDFLSMMSHKLKSPLTQIIGYAEMLLEGLSGEVNDDQKMFLQTIMNFSEQMISMVQTMDELSQIQRSTVDTLPESTDVVSMLERVYQNGKKQGDLHDVVVEFDASDDLPEVWVDEIKVCSALDRIVENAVKYTPAGGQVRISMNSPTDSDVEGMDGSFVAISIADSGIGIDAQDLSRTFEPFFSVNAGFAESQTAGGIGLTIAQAYIEADGGKILVKSKQGKGSTFTVLLPTVS